MCLLEVVVRMSEEKKRKEKKVPYFNYNTQTCTVHSYIIVSWVPKAGKTS